MRCPGVGVAILSERFTKAEKGAICPTLQSQKGSSGHWYRGLSRLIFPYSMAEVGQPQMQAMQWVHRPPQTGLPCSRRMLPKGQSRSHLPQEMQALETAKGPALT